MRRSSRYDFDVVHELLKIAKKIPAQMKDSTFSEKELKFVSDLLQEFKLAYDARKIHEGATMWLLEQYLTEPAEAVVKARVTITSSAN